MVIVLFVLTPFEHSTLALYIGGVILPSTLELVGGWALYKLYHTRWWDYSDMPFNIDGYICLEFFPAVGRGHAGDDEKPSTPQSPGWWSWCRLSSGSS